MPRVGESARKVDLVGEANPYGADPRYALFYAPAGSAGQRLCDLVLGMSYRDYLASFNRVNLCPHKWSLRTAREGATMLRGRYCILLGAKVCQAFDVPYEPFQAQYPGTPEGGGGLLVLPHPSGLCRLWNEPGTFELAKQAVRAFAPHLADLVGKYDVNGDLTCRE